MVSVPVVGAAVAATTEGTWVSYTGAARLVLVLVLITVAVVLLAVGRRLALPVPTPRFGTTAVGFLLVAWLLAIATFLVAFGAYVTVGQEQIAAQPPPTDPITPVTFTAAGLTFAVILASAPLTWVRAASAVIAAAAAPMLFELPFDLIVMSRTTLLIPPNPALFRALFFLPLFLVEVITLALLIACPGTRITRWTLWLLAGMFAVFAVWAVFGFGYPSTPTSITANVVSKLLAFAATLSLFFPTEGLPKDRSRPTEPTSDLLAPAEPRRSDP